MNHHRPHTQEPHRFRLTVMAIGLGLFSGAAVPAPSVAGGEPGVRTVQQGENLSRIAESLCPPADRLCVRRHILAIYRENPQVFAGELTHLSVGDRLKLPAPQVVQAIPPAEAMAVYENYRNPSTAPLAAAPEPVAAKATTPDSSKPTTVAAAVPLPVTAAVAATSKAQPRAAARAGLQVAQAGSPPVISDATADVAAAAAPSTPAPSPSEAATAYQDESETGQTTDFQGTAAPLVPKPQAPAPQPTPIAAPSAPATPTPAAAAVPGPAPQAAAATTAPAATTPATPPGRVRVPFIPESEKKRIREEIREEVLATAKRENWAQPNAIPDWVKKMKVSGDLRTRGEAQLYDQSNNSQIFNFQAINAGAPINTTPPAAGQPLALPILNTTEDRRLLRLQARLGLGVTISPDLSLSLRLATGNAVSPVSSNQTLGSDFNKLNVLLDRAYLRYTPRQELAVHLGRQPNPYGTPQELVWDRDLSFDGLNAQWSQPWRGNQLRVASGFFSVENTDPNYPGNSLQKASSYDKWLAALQLEWSRQFGKDRSLRAALGYYDFLNAEGQLSSPCFAPSTAVACNTDSSRPGFVQKGNTLFAIRDLRLANPGDAAFQYFGLATPFRVANLSVGYDLRLDGPLHLALDAEYAHNLAFNEGDIKARTPVNNFGPCAPGVGTCVQQVEIGNDAWQLQARVGYPVVRQRAEWQALVGYKHVESDALPDAFTDSDFHLGGTNAKGYYIGGTVGFSSNATVSLRYLSATEITGPRLGIDVLQVDVGARF